MAATTLELMTSIDTHKIRFSINLFAVFGGFKPFLVPINTK